MKKGTRDWIWGFVIFVALLTLVGFSAAIVYALLTFIVWR